MDMSGYFGGCLNKVTLDSLIYFTNIIEDGSAVAHIGQLLLCKLGNVSSDFHSEELCCIKKDSQVGHPETKVCLLEQIFPQKSGM